MIWYLVKHEQLYLSFYLIHPNGMMHS